MRLFANLTLLLASLALVAVSWLAHRDDLRGREALDAFVARFELEQRRPADVATLRLQPQPDLAAVMIAAMTLEDVYGSVRLRDLDAATRASWLRAVSATGTQIDEAIGCSLDAIARRPGWAFHHSMLSQLAYTRSRRESPAAVARDAAGWEVPALAAIALAPGNLAVRAFLGGAYLESWERATTRRPRLDVLRDAMKSAAFVDRSYDAVAAAAGRERAIALLPDDVTVLRVALGRETRERRVDEAATLRSRLDASIRHSRARGIARIELLGRRRDRLGLSVEIPAWLARHRLEEIDTPEGRRDVARVAALVPAMRRGAWPNDPRARLLRHMLDGREREMEGESFARLAASLSGVPEPIEARALALGGDPFAARELLLASDTRGSFEWTPAIVAIARAQLNRGDAASALAILEELAPTARDECDALLALRDASDAAARQAIAPRVDAVTPRAIPSSAWSRSGSLSLCIDPATMSRQRLGVVLNPVGPALVSWGWNGGREASVVVRERTILHVPLEGREGRVVFSLHTEAGGPIVPGDATIGE